MDIWYLADRDTGMVMVVVTVIDNSKGASDGIEITYCSRVTKSASIAILREA